MLTRKRLRELNAPPLVVPSLPGMKPGRGRKKALVIESPRLPPPQEALNGAPSSSSPTLMNHTEVDTPIETVTIHQILARKQEEEERVQKVLEESQKEREALEQERSAIQKEREDFELQRAILQRQRDEAHRERDAYQQRLEEVIQLRDTLVRERDDVVKTRDEFQQLYHKKERSVIEKSGEIETLKSQLKASEVMRDLYWNGRERLAKQFDSTTKKKNELQQALDESTRTLGDKITALTHELSTRDAQLHMQNQEIGALRASLNQAIHDVNVLRHSPQGDWLAQQQAHLAAQKGELERRVQEVNTRAKEVEGLKGKLLQDSRELEARRSELEQWRESANQTIQSRQEELTREHQALKNARVEFDRTCRQREQANEAYKETIRQQYGARELPELKSKVEQYEARMAEQERTLEELKMALRQSEHSYEMQQVVLRGTEEDLEVQTKALKEAREEVKAQTSIVRRLEQELMLFRPNKKPPQPKTSPTPKAAPKEPRRTLEELRRDAQEHAEASTDVTCMDTVEDHSRGEVDMEDNEDDEEGEDTDTHLVYKKTYKDHGVFKWMFKLDPFNLSMKKAVKLLHYKHGGLQRASSEFREASKEFHPDMARKSTLSPKVKSRMWDIYSAAYDKVKALDAHPDRDYLLRHL
jgi:chromosome segregation ATPase